MSRINISLSDELKAKMEQPKFKHINWSEVAAKAFEKEMAVKRYCFYLRVIGSGETIEEAFEDAMLEDTNPHGLPKYDSVLCLDDDEPITEE
jgi:hypothetical protein